MIQLIELYAWTIPAGAVFGVALALLGCQIAARERVLQMFCVSQSALVGVLLGLGLATHAVHQDPETHLAPLLFSLVCSMMVFLFTESFAQRIRFSRNTFFATIFAILLSVTYLISVLFPSLESHMANMFFGDLATLTEFDSQVTLAIGVVALVALILFRKPITCRSFDMAIYGERRKRVWQTRNMVFLALTILLLCYAVQFLGFLFTISMLFLPTTFFALDITGGIRAHFWRVCIFAGVSSLLGFLLSLKFTRLPTTPTICLLLAFLASAWLLFTFTRRRLANRGTHDAIRFFENPKK